MPASVDAPKQTFENLPEDFQELLLNGLAPAA